MAQSEQTIQLFKSRSYAACIKEGIRFLADNPWKVFRSLWPYLLLAALCSWFFYVSIASLQLPAGAQLSAVGILWLLLSYVVVGAGMLFFTARVMLLFQRFAEKGRAERIGAFALFGQTAANALRLLPFLLFEMLFIAGFLQLASLAMSWAAKQQTVTMLVCAVIALVAVALIALVFILPLVQSLYHCQLGQGRFMQLVKTGYRRGFRHKGKIFVTNLLACFLFFLVGMLVAMPLFIVMSANIFSNVGILMGDPSGTPSYFPWLTAITYVVSFLLLYFVGVFLYSSNLFAYGSIEAQEQEREAMAAERAQITSQMNS